MSLTFDLDRHIILRQAGTTRAPQHTFDDGITVFTMADHVFAAQSDFFAYGKGFGRFWVLMVDYAFVM
jgi:hypothetical protein